MSWAFQRRRIEGRYRERFIFRFGSHSCGDTANLKPAGQAGNPWRCGHSGLKATCWQNLFFQRDLSFSTKALTDWMMSTHVRRVTYFSYSLLVY